MLHIMTKRPRVRNARRAGAAHPRLAPIQPAAIIVGFYVGAAQPDDEPGVAYLPIAGYLVEDGLGYFDPIAMEPLPDVWCLWFVLPDGRHVWSFREDNDYFTFDAAKAHAIALLTARRAA